MNNNEQWKRFRTYYRVALINFLITIFTLFFLFTTALPKYSITKNGDIIIQNIRWLIVDHLKIQQFETDVETLETEVVYYIEPVQFGDSNVILTNETATIIANKLFSINGHYQITFGKVIAPLKREAFLLIIGLYLGITLYLVPYLFSKFR